MVYYGQYGVMSMLLRESRDEVHCNLLKGEGAFFSGDAVERYFLPMSHDFILLADCTSFHVVCYPLSHSCPWQGFCCFPDRFILSRVSCHGVVVDEGHEVPFGGIWDLCYVGGIDKEFRFKEGLILVVVVSLIQIWWV